jgi:hypothetical protein
MLVIGLLPLGIFVTLLGIGLMVVTIYGRWFKVGRYPRSRIVLSVFIGVGVLISALSLRIFMNPPRDIYWVVYFVVAILLFLPPWIYLLRPSKNHEGVIKNERE